MNSKHAFLALSVFTLVSIAHGEREVFAPTKLAPTATAGTVQFGDGTVAAPSITFSADNNTGFFRNGNDQIGYSLGGVTRGVMSGTDLYVGGGTGSSAPGNGAIRATSGSGTNIGGGNLEIIGGNSTGSGAGGVVRILTAPAGASGSTANTLTERMRITADGLTQINKAIELGNTITDYPVSTAPQIYSTGNGTGIFADYGNLVLQPRSSGALRNIIFANGNPATERVRIDSAGNVIAGNGDTSATPANATIRGTNASGTDIGGPNLTIQAGRGTGSASGGSILLQTAPTGTTGSTLNAAVTRMVVHTNGTVFVGPSSVSATPTTGNISSAGGSGTNIAGSGLDIRAGAGTGTGAGGSINLYTASPGGVSGSGLNSQTARVTLKPGGQLRFVPLAAAPTVSVEDGDVYYNSTTNKLQVRAAGVWVDLH